MGSYGYYNRTLNTNAPTPQMDISALLRGGQAVAGALSSVKADELANAKLAEDQRRWGITNNRAQDLADMQKQEFDRKQQEKLAEGTYYAELAKGPQTRSGILTDLATNANQYALSPQEIEVSKTLQTPEQARKAGNEVLAKKLEWQQGMSDLATQLPTSDYGKESRSGMYARAMDTLSRQGLMPTSEMMKQMNEAKLAEVEAQNKKLDENIKASAQLGKDDIANAKYLIQNSGGVGTQGTPTYDTEGNLTGYTGGVSKLDVRRDDKNDEKFAKGQIAISDYFNKLGTKDSEAVKINALNNYKLLLATDPTLDPAAVASTIVGQVSKDTPNAFMSMFKDPTAKFNEGALKDLMPALSGAHTPLQPTGKSEGGISEKELMTRDLTASIAAKNNAERARLVSERANLLKTEDERTNDRLTALMQSRGLLPSAEPTPTVTPKETSRLQTKMPESLVISEGVRAKPYDDGKGNITVGVGYNLNKDKSELERDFKAAGIPLEKINGLKQMDGTTLTNQEISNLANVSYDQYGVKKLSNIGIDISKLNPTLAEIGVSQAFRGDIVKDGKGYQGKLYEYLKNDDLDGMVKFAFNDKSVPKEVKTRINNVVNRYGAITEEQAKYEGIPTGPVTGSSKVKELFNNVNDTTKEPTDEKKQAFINTVKQDIANGDLSNTVASARLQSQLGITEKEANSILNEAEDKRSSDANIARRNYLTAVREGTFQGKTPDEWYNEMSTKDQIGTKYGPLAPIVAAAGPLAGLYSSLFGAGATGAGADAGGTLLRGNNFTTRVVEDPILKKAGAETTKLAKDRELQNEISSLVSGNLNPEKIKRLLDISATNSKFSPGIREFLKTRGF